MPFPCHFIRTHLSFADKYGENMKKGYELIPWKRVWENKEGKGTSRATNEVTDKAAHRGAIMQERRVRLASGV